jgi:hypothetical protein
MNRLAQFEGLVARCENELIKRPGLCEFEMIITQLKYLIDLETGRSDDANKLPEITIGRIAVRGLDGYDNKDLISALCGVMPEVDKMIIERKSTIREIDDRNQIIITTPISYPDKIVLFLKKIFSNRKDIKKIYLSALRYPKPDYQKKILIGLIVDGDFDKILIELFTQAMENQIPLETIEFTDAKNGEYQDYFLRIKPFL